MNDPLAPLLADGVIDEVLSRLKSGKEADVWLVRSGGQVVAAKVYKARHARSFKNDAAYKEGRHVRNTRTQRAMDKGSRFGQAASEEAWKAKESDALHRLHAIGLRVPRPVMFYEGVLLMELVVDAHGHPAPRLVDAHLGREQAAPLYAELRKQAIGMLACDLIHGDLSPYNVLAGADGPVVIDFPQVVGAAHNSQAERFFLRDLENVRRFCAALDPALRIGEGEGREIWRAYERRELTVDFVPTGRVPAAHPPREGQGQRPQQHPRHSQQNEHRRTEPRPPPQRGQQQQPQQPRRDQPQLQPRQQRGQPPQQQPQRGQQPLPRQRGQGRPQPSRPQQGQPQRPPPQPNPRGPDPRGRRSPPAPEIVRIDRPFAARPADPARAASPRPGHRGPGGHPHGRGGHGHGGGGHGGQGGGGHGGQGGHGGHGPKGR